MKFKRGRPPTIAFDAGEQGLLLSLATQLHVLLSPEESDDSDPLTAIVGTIESSDEAPDDPVLQRLLPDAYRDDDEAAAEWRRLGRSDVRSAKLVALERVVNDLEDTTSLRLTDDAISPWLGALTDMRLAIGARLDITEDWVEVVTALEQDDPRLAAYAVYDWLSNLQETILQAIS